MSKDILDSIVTSEDLVMIGEAIKTQKHAIESIIEDKKYDGEKNNEFIDKCNQLYDRYSELFTRLVQFMIKHIDDKGMNPSAYFLVPIVPVEDGDTNGIQQ